MKNLEELKSKHQEFKKLLVDTVEYINSEDFFNLTSSEKNFVNQFRVGVEVTTNALTNLSFGDILSYDFGGSMIFPMLLSSIMSPGSFGRTPSSEASEELSKVINEEKQKKDEDGCSD
jgi:hypothetical protein